MKKLSTESLQSLKNDFEFMEGTIKSHFESSQNKMIYFTPTDHLVFECQNCGSPYYFEKNDEYCNHCSSFTKDYIFDKTDTDEYGIFCRRCGTGFSNWVCEDCKTSNPVEGTFQRLNKKGGGGCFIATAVYGTPFANEVIILKEFRDNWLLNFRLGKMFVAFYYWISPPIANQIAKSNSLKAITKSTLVIPLIKIANYLKRKEN